MYSSKYALSDGIKEFEPHEKLSSSDYVYDGPWTTLRVGRDAFHELADAVADAEKRRIKRIASLKKQIKKLESLTFNTHALPPERAPADAPPLVAGLTPRPAD